MEKFKLVDLGHYKVNGDRNFQVKILRVSTMLFILDFVDVQIYVQIQ
jgi:hypothetical protein